ncbi:MAG: transposase [Caulobacteraceae bacterium]|nr:MAG: transposase [Caulobacteraceae bacterium]
MDAERRIAELEAELAAKDAIIAEQAVRIAVLEQQVAVLTEQVARLSELLGQSSRNSHKPPSSDGPAAREERNQNKKKSSRGRGGQPGHQGNRRHLLPPAEVDQFVELFPPQCKNCWEPLPQVPDESPRRYQHTELPPVKPHTTEYRRHAVKCPGCGYRTRAAYDEATIPASPFGPRLMALMALLTGVYHLSRRRAATLLDDVLGVRVSIGALSAVEARVSEAVKPAVAEAWVRVEGAEVKHTDGTGWLQAGASLSLWTLATTAATVFKVVKTGSTELLRPLYGALRGVLVSDRATALNFWAMRRRQVCWAHLLRKFVSFSERGGPAGAFGRELLDYAGLIFTYWHHYKDRKLSRAEFRAWMAPVQEQFEAALGRAAQADIARLSGSCANILEHREALWTFVERDDVEPTNNHAERELRAFVLWRKRSFGTQSERGNLFAERVMSVAHTARKQHKNVLAFLTACCTAQRDRAPPPSLFDAEPAAA